jgi:hypothetical protein
MALCSLGTETSGLVPLIQAAILAVSNSFGEQAAS